MKTSFRTWMFDNVQLRTAGCLVVALALPGCALRGNSELLEAQLRKQESTIRQYESQTSKLKQELALSQRELDLVRADQAAQGKLVSAEETTRNLAEAEGLVFNSLLTGGQDRDGAGGDERFHAVFYPHDAQGEIVKLSGRLEVEAIDLSRPTDKKSLGRWEYTAEESRQLWLAGFLTSGFQIDEAWQSLPTGSKVLLYAKLTTSDGRTFEATHTIPIDVSPTSGRAPETLPPPAKSTAIEQASFEVPSASRTVPDPAPWEFEQPTEKAKPKRPSDTMPAKVELQPAPALLPGGAKPFPTGTQTSDNWTEETMPVVR